jgi:hypothetical protein
VLAAMTPQQAQALTFTDVDLRYYTGAFGKTLGTRLRRVLSARHPRLRRGRVPVAVDWAGDRGIVYLRRDNPYASDWSLHFLDLDTEQSEPLIENVSYSEAIETARYLLIEGDLEVVGVMASMQGVARRRRRRVRRPRGVELPPRETVVRPGVVRRRKP